MKQRLIIEDLRLCMLKQDQPQELVRGISLEIEQGKVLALVGGSGCGKSLTCAGLQGILPAGVFHAGGRTFVDDSVRQWEVRPGHDVATIMQHPRSAFDPLMTMRMHAKETARYAAKPQELTDARFGKYLAEVGLTDPRVPDLYPFEMSGGMLQRAMLAMALISDTPFIVADEPTTALDLVMQAKVLEMLKHICQKHDKGMLLVTHDMGVVAYIATDVAVMHQGRIVETGAVSDIFYRPRHPRTRSLVQAHLALYPQEELVA